VNHKALAAAIVAVATPAAAGGLSRPNLISARGVGLGGAFTAIADDVTALHFNPAGLAYQVPSFALGVELVVAPRSYTPILPDGTRGDPQEATPIVPVPALGITGRFANDGVPSNFTLGIGVWNTFGGQVHYDKMPGGSALDATEDVVVEIVPGFAYRFDDRLAFGASLRIGVGLFAVEATQMPVDSELSARGLGVSYTGGVLVTPVDALRIGLTWRAPLTIRTEGSGTVELPGGTETRDVRHTQQWPQQLSLGVVARVAPAVRLTGQLDWSDWSRVDVIAVEFPSDASLNQNYDVDWNDNVAIRAGGEYTASERLALRGGAYFDSNAVPDRTIERQYLDDNKFGVSAGASARIAGKWRLDGAIDVTLPGSRTVDDNSDELSSWRDRANVAPGDHEGSVFTLELAVSRQLR
jgi:long-chain fatty acid transport protein